MDNLAQILSLAESNSVNLFSAQGLLWIDGDLSNCPDLALALATHAQDLATYLAPTLIPA